VSTIKNRILMIKEHRVTKLKYLCVTTQKDPKKYKGSGYYWKNHIKTHGPWIDTTIVYQTTDLDEFKKQCLHYSNLWNIVEERDQTGKKIWANLVPETGVTGGSLKGEKHFSKQPGYMPILNPNANRLKSVNHWTKNPNYKPRFFSKESRMKSSANQPSKLPGYISPISGNNHYTKKPEYNNCMVGNNNPNYDHTIYNWENVKTGEKLARTRYEMSKYLDCHRCNITAVISGKNKTVFGWKLVRI
jgi:hypothetical protein